MRAASAVGEGSGAGPRGAPEAGGGPSPHLTSLRELPAGSGLAPREGGRPGSEGEGKHPGPGRECEGGSGG